MKKTSLRLLLPVLGVALLGSVAGAQSLTPPPPAPSQSPPAPLRAPLGPPAAVSPAATPPPGMSPAVPPRPLDLIATITLATGKAETFGREIDRLEIVTRPGGAIEMIHLVLAAAGQRNTHVWYNYAQVAKLSYRFVSAEGRSKVYVRPLQASPTTRALTDRLEPLSPREFR